MSQKNSTGKLIRVSSFQVSSIKVYKASRQSNKTTLSQTRSDAFLDGNDEAPAEVLQISLLLAL